MKTRLTTAADIKPLQSVLDQTELFPSEMLPDMIADFLSSDDSSDIWLTCELDGIPIGFCYATPEALTEGTWNMLAIAVLPSSQTHGAGSALTNHLEELLRRHRVCMPKELTDDCQAHPIGDKLRRVGMTIIVDSVVANIGV